MGIYYHAADEEEKKIISSPDGFSIKEPGIYHPLNPFPNMVMMMNLRGYHFELYNDMGAAYEAHCEKEYEDITEYVWSEFCKEFPEAEDHYSKNCE